MLKLTLQTLLTLVVLPNCLFGQYFDSDSYFPFYLKSDTSCSLTVEEFYYTKKKKSILELGPDTIKTYTFDSIGSLIPKINGNSIYSKKDNEITYISTNNRNDSIFYVFNGSNYLIKKHTISEKIQFGTQIETNSFYYKNGLIKTIKTQYGIFNYNAKNQKVDTIYREPSLCNFEYQKKKLLKVKNNASEFRYTYLNKNEIVVELYSYELERLIYKWLIKKSW